MKGTRTRSVSRFSVLALASAVASTAVLSGCSPTSSAETSTDATQISVVGYSAPKAANNAVEAAFEKTPDGEGVTFEESYGASGDQSRAVAGGLAADYVHFSIEPDVTRLVEADKVAKDWNSGANKGIVTDSVVVFVVRKGNPKKITGWDDLAKPGVGIVTPNPGSSGSARWNILGAWLHITGAGGSEADATKFVGSLLANVKALPGSGREATTAFQGGTGDVLLSYENEAILARQNGEDIDYVVPDDTLKIENPGAVTTQAGPEAKAFLDFAISPEGQAIYASKGFRPLETTQGVEVGTVEGANDPSNPYPSPGTLYTIDDLDGWSSVTTKFFDPDKGIITKLLSKAGAS